MYVLRDWERRREKRRIKVVKKGAKTRIGFITRPRRVTNRWLDRRLHKSDLQYYARRDATTTTIATAQALLLCRYTKDHTLYNNILTPIALHSTIHRTLRAFVSEHCRSRRRATVSLIRDKHNILSLFYLFIY